MSPRHDPSRSVGPALEAGRRALVALRQARRLVDWAIRPAAYPAPRHAPPVAALPHRVWSARVAIGREDPDADPRLETGKRTNLALAAPAFDGLWTSPGRPLSFWRALGPMTAARGFVHGLSFRGGCLVPTLGGGVCLLSNALFAMAAGLGWRVLERHGHTLEAIPAGPGEVWGLDATVAWPHVDLRVAPAEGHAVLGCRIEGDALVLTVNADRPAPAGVVVAAEAVRDEETSDGLVRSGRLVRRTLAASGHLVAAEVLGESRKRVLSPPERARTCLTCGETACAARVAPERLGREAT